MLQGYGGARNAWSGRIQGERGGERWGGLGYVVEDGVLRALGRIGNEASHGMVCWGGGVVGGGGVAG